MRAVLVLVVSTVLVTSACWAEGAPSSPEDHGAGEFEVIAGGAAPPARVEKGHWGAALGRELPDDVAFTDPGELPELRTTGGRPLPLRHTRVGASIVGFVAQVEVAQTFHNDLDVPIEVVYAFPLPENAAVMGMRMVIGSRVIESRVRHRGEARAAYERAKRGGRTSALLEQERTNIFTQSVANVAPGQDLDIVVDYAQDLAYDAGSYEFVFPMVVGPRFVHEGVPDAARLRPPVVGAGERTGHDIEIEVSLDSGVPIVGYDVPTHAVEVQARSDAGLSVRLAERKSIPNRDFVLRYRVAGKGPEGALLTEAGDSGGYFSLVIQPPAIDVDERVGQREVVFVIDVSGSMSGFPLEMCKDAMQLALSKLRPLDTFNVLTFSGATRWVFDGPVVANTSNLRHALMEIDGLHAGGGTYVDDALGEALGAEIEHGRHRFVLLMSDGFVAIEERVFGLARGLVERFAKRGQTARVMTYGVGSSVNRELIAGLARAGNGVAVVTTLRESPDRAVNAFFRYIDRPVLERVEVDWGGMKVEEVHPEHPADLFASHPIIVHGRYRGRPVDTVVVRGMVGSTRIELPVARRAAPPGTSVMGTLWARAKVADLARGLWDGPDRRIERAITEVGLAHGLVTPYTSLVAVDASARVGDGAPVRIDQPVEIADGVDPVMAGANQIVTEMGLIAVVQRQRARRRGPLAGEPVVRKKLELRMRLTRRVPTLRVGPARTSGPRKDRRAIRRVVSRVRRSLRRCTQRHGTSVVQRGRVVIEFTVDEAIAGVRIVSGSLGSRAANHCVVGVIKRMPPPAVSTPTTVRLPLELEVRRPEPLSSFMGR